MMGIGAGPTWADVQGDPGRAELIIDTPDFVVSTPCHLLAQQLIAESLLALSMHDVMEAWDEVEGGERQEDHKTRSETPDHKL